MEETYHFCRRTCQFYSPAILSLHWKQTRNLPSFRKTTLAIVGPDQLGWMAYQDRRALSYWTLQWSSKSFSGCTASTSCSKFRVSHWNPLLRRRTKRLAILGQACANLGSIACSMHWWWHFVASLHWPLKKVCGVKRELSALDNSGHGRKRGAEVMISDPRWLNEALLDMSGRWIRNVKVHPTLCFAFSHPLNLGEA